MCCAAALMIHGMTFRFNPRAFGASLLIFVLLILLATFGARTGWLRSFFGDVLAVIWLFYLFKTRLAARPVPLAFAAFGVGCALELTQYLARLWHLQIGNRVLRIVVGSTPDWMDVLAYAIGFVAVLSIESVCRFRASRPMASAS